MKLFKLHLPNHMSSWANTWWETSGKINSEWLIYLVILQTTYFVDYISLQCRQLSEIVAIPGHAHFFAQAHLVNEIGCCVMPHWQGCLYHKYSIAWGYKPGRWPSSPETTVTELKPDAIQFLTEYMTVHFYIYWVCLYYRYWNIISPQNNVLVCCRVV